MAIQLIPGGFLAIGSLFLRESPALLLRKGQEEKAMRNLTYLRMLPADHPYILEEVAIHRARIIEEQELAGDRGGVSGYLLGAIRELKIKHIRHRV